jgi:hypothetical protein
VTSRVRNVPSVRLHSRIVGKKVISRKRMYEFIVVLKLIVINKLHLQLFLDY